MPKLVPTVADAEARADIVEIGWELFPEHILDALDLLLVHLGVHDKLARKATWLQPKTSQGKLLEAVPMRRAIPRDAIVAAHRILWVNRSYAAHDGMAYWHLDVKGTWRQRLILAGIDEKTVEVCDRRRWAFCYQQLTEDRKPHFIQSIQVKLFESDLPTPELTPKVNRIKRLNGQAKKRIKKKLEEQARRENNHREEIGMGQQFPTGSIGDRFGRRLDY